MLVVVGAVFSAGDFGFCLGGFGVKDFSGLRSKKLRKCSGVALALVESVRGVLVNCRRRLGARKRHW